MKGKVSLGGVGLMALAIAVAGGCGDDSTELGNIGGASVGTAGSDGTSTGGSGTGGDSNTGGSNTGGGGSGPDGSSMGGGGSAPDGGTPDAVAPQDGSSSDVTTNDSAVNDSATEDAASADAADAPPPVCSAPTDPAPGIVGTVIDAPMPNDAAGTMVYSGTYYRTQYLFYQGSSAAGDVRKQTLRIDVANINFYDEDVTSPYSGGWGYGTFTTNGSTLTLSTTCPVVAQLPVPYTATDTTLKLYETDKKRVQIFTKQ